MRGERSELPFARPLAVAVDVVIFTVAEGKLSALLTRRTREPFKGRWSLPGGFVGPSESAEAAAERELAKKTGLAGVYLEQLYTFSAPHRDPRTRVISIAYVALVAAARLAPGLGSRETRWFPVGALPAEGLAFDHGQILATAAERVRGKLEHTPIGAQLLPEKFTLSEMQEVYEAVLGQAMDKRNFRAKLLRSGRVRELRELRTGPHRPARLYSFRDRGF